jgi:CheY-like chemotaxis protein
MRKGRFFDAVIADGHMPGFIGHEFAGFCRIAWPDTPVILLSGDLNSVTDYADEVDAVACIRKPYEAAMLLSVLRIATQPVLTEATFSMAQMTH